MTKISNKTPTHATKAALTARLGARKIAKKRSSSKEHKKRWLALKLRLASAQTALNTALKNKDVPRQQVWALVEDKVLTEMRTFSDYKYTNTGKKYGAAECLGCESGVDASSAHTCRD